MRAIIQESAGGRLQVGEVDRPVPVAREILIHVTYAALNRMDLLQAKGGYPLPPNASPILGVGK